MPNFMYTLILLEGALTVLCAHIVLTCRPETTYIITLFIILTGVWSFLALSIALFFINKKKSPEFTNFRVIYRRGLHTAFILSCSVMALLFLKAFDLLTKTSALILTLFLASLTILNPLNKR